MNGLKIKRPKVINLFELAVFIFLLMAAHSYFFNTEKVAMLEEDKGRVVYDKNWKSEGEKYIDSAAQVLEKKSSMLGTESLNGEELKND